MEGGDDTSLSSFRKQWQQELTSRTADRRGSSAVQQLQDRLQNVQLNPQSHDSSSETMAKSLFEQAAQLEAQGRVFDAIPLYKKAVHLVPDIEYKMHEWNKQKQLQEDAQEKKVRESDRNEKKNESSSALLSEEQHVDLYTRFLANFQGRLCENGTPPGVISSSNAVHISALPHEVFLIVLRWVVSSDLDVRSLENCARVCQGFYLQARDPQLWRLMCLKIWGLQLGSLKGSTFTSWRQMYFNRPRLRFDGCYISKTEYFRLGENTFQDSSYKPVHHVEYFRYLRFFPDGLCLMMTSSDEPSIGVKKLRSRHFNRREILQGLYRLTNDTVTIRLQRKQTVESQVITVPERRTGNSNSNKGPIVDTSEQIFHAVLRVQRNATGRKRGFNQLHWDQYRVLQIRNGVEVSSSEFHLNDSKFPVLYFSRVEHYHQEASDIFAL